MTESPSYDAAMSSVSRFLGDRYRDAATLGLAVVAMPRFKLEPLWVYFVGPPSDGKTELLRALYSQRFSVMRSDLTPKSLVSGLSSKKDADVLPFLDGKTLLLQDLTTLFGKDEDSIRGIVGRLRSMYDGEFSASYGSVGTKTYKSFFNVLAATVPTFAGKRIADRDLGERFLTYHYPDPRDAVRDIESGPEKTDNRADMKSAFASVLSGSRNLPLPLLDPSAKDAIADLANLVRRGRATVPRDSYTHDVVALPSPEGPQRLQLQFLTLSQGVALVRGHSVVEPSDLRLVSIVAFDCLPEDRIMVLRFINERGGSATYSGLAHTVPIAHSTVRRTVQDLEILGLIEHDKTGMRFPNSPTTGAIRFILTPFSP